MLAKVNKNFLLALLIVVFIVALVVIVGGTILGIVKARKASKKVIFRTLGSIIIAAISWILNFGWLRFMMTFLLFPIIHGILFFLANMFFCKYTDESPLMSKWNLLFIITYLIAYVFLPDAADAGGMYFFFGLINSDILSDVAYYLSIAAGIAHIVLFVLQFCEIRKIKKG